MHLDAAAIPAKGLRPAAHRLQWVIEFHWSNISVEVRNQVKKFCFSLKIHRLRLSYKIAGGDCAGSNLLVFDAITSRILKEQVLTSSQFVIIAMNINISYKHLNLPIKILRNYHGEKKTNDDVDGNEPVRVRRLHVCVSHACDPISNNSIIKTRKQFPTFPFDMKPPAAERTAKRKSHRKSSSRPRVKERHQRFLFLFISSTIHQVTSPNDVGQLRKDFVIYWHLKMMIYRVDLDAVNAPRNLHSSSSPHFHCVPRWR